MTAIRATRGLELPRHLRAAARTLLYLLLGLPYCITYLLVVCGGLLLGAVLSIAWSGLPLLAAVARLPSPSARHASTRTISSTAACWPCKSVPCVAKKYPSQPRQCNCRQGPLLGWPCARRLFSPSHPR